MSKHPTFDEFVETIAALRAPDGCPWDRVQTHESIARNMIEEAYEVVDTVEQNDIDHLREELGDVLLQVVLQSQIAQDAGEFTIDDVCREVNAKIVRRHPHVFGDEKATGASEVLELWDAIKLTEKKGAGEDGDATSAEEREGLLAAVPTSFPALMQAQKISRKVVSAGFEWETLDQVWEQVFSEIEELKQAYAVAPKDERGKVIQKTDAAEDTAILGSADEVELEMGDVLFSLTNVARKMGIDAESGLRASNRKFRARWAFIEGAAWARGLEVEQLSLVEMEELWKQAKMREHAYGQGENGGERPAIGVDAGLEGREIIAEMPTIISEESDA